MSSKKFHELENLIGIHFKNYKYLEEALTHKSYAVEHNKKLWNERMEFLGDSILSAIVADYLYTTYPDLSEGELSRIKSQLISREALYYWAKELKLNKFILLSSGEEATGGRNRKSILSNALESLLGAIYLEKGYEEVKNFVVKSISKKQHALNTDYKSCLQEIVQKRYKILPTYVVTKESGPEHDKTFEVEVGLRNTVLGRGKGKSKKAAEQAAAREALKRYKQAYSLGI